MPWNIPSDWVSVASFVTARLVRQDGGCWIWPHRQNMPTRHQYGQIQIAGRWWRLNRVMWTMTRGSIPEGMQVCHTCDTPACVRPDHLWLGSNRANAVDREIKKRGRWTGRYA